jgi:octaprenyl-diphosphate synthase
MQVGNRGNLHLTEDEYFEIINGKTAELCACATHLGAYYADGAPEIVDRFESFGRELGLAFQIVDDLLDLVGDEKKTGKSLGSDLENQKLTLPLIHLVRSADSQDEKVVLGILDEPVSPESRMEIQRQLDKYQSLEYAKQRAIGLAHSAVAQIADLPSSKAKDTLVAMAEFVVARTH